MTTSSFNLSIPKRLTFVLLTAMWLTITSTSVLLSPVSIQAAETCPANVQCSGGCTAAGQCSNGRTCVEKTTNIPLPPDYVVRPVTSISASGEPCGGGEGRAVLGGIQVPWGVQRYNPSGQSTSESIGIVVFASRVLRIFTIIAGIWFMFNMLIAGYMFITSSGDTGIFGKFKETLYFSLIGLVIISAAYLIAALVGAVFFGDAGFIIRPTLFQAVAP